MYPITKSVLACISFFLCGILFANLSLISAQELEPLNRFPRMMQDWMVSQVRAAESRGNERREAVQSKEDAEHYVDVVRRRIRQVFGPFPEKTPLNARVGRRVERDEYTIENILFESRPGFPVTGNLYLPKGKAYPLPGVIGVCGHSTNGKAAESYQAFAQSLARLGYVVFIIDPAGQGERFQFLNADLTSKYRPGVSEHIHAGNQMTLVGEFLGTWFAWDAIRALDYLVTRPEVDQRHLGVTGNSGGGTQTTWLCGLEDRWTMAAPACFMTTVRRNAENELPQDTEQCPPNLLALDLDHSDFLAAQAPKPVMILAQELDYFDARGAEEAASRLKRLYGYLGHGENAQLTIGPSPHGYSQDNREAMYRFFNRVTGISQAQTEPPLTIEKDEVLFASPLGQVHADPSTRTIFSLTRDKAIMLNQARGDVNGEKLTKAVREVLKLPAEPTIPDYRILRGLGSRRYPKKGYCTYAVETEPGIHTLVTRLHDGPLTARPPKGIKKAILYISHRSADEELRSESLIQRAIEADPEAAIYSMDVRGIGDSQPDICGKDQFLREYGSDYFISAYSLMLGRPYLGQRTWDVMQTIEWLSSLGHEEIHVIGSGWGALPAAFAAYLHEDVDRVTLKHALGSYFDITQTEDYAWPYAVMLPNVLASFDLPDIYRELHAKKLELLEPWGARDGMATP